eukprot:2134863-Rhodomonas_salina.2
MLLPGVDDPMSDAMGGGSTKQARQLRGSYVVTAASQLLDNNALLPVSPLWAYVWLGAEFSTDMSA